MSDLADYQRAFVEAIDARRYVHPAQAVYRNGAVRAAIDALADNFPTVATILGREPFGELAASFVGEHAPDSPVLARYGAPFPAWIEGQKIGQLLPYLAGVAAIDLLRTEAHLAADGAPIAPDTLAERPADQWSRSRVVLHPAVRFGWYAVPAPSIWLAHWEPCSAEIAPEWKGEGIILTRPHDAVRARKIGPAEHRILAGLRIGETIGAAAGAAHALYPDADITHAFRGILASGAIGSLKPGGTS